MVSECINKKVKEQQEKTVKGNTTFLKVKKEENISE